MHTGTRSPGAGSRVLTAATPTNEEEDTMSTVTTPAAPRARAGGLVRTLAAIFCAFTVAAVGAALGAWVGWRGAPALPSDSAALSLIGPDTGLTAVGRNDAVFAYEHESGPLTWLIGDDDYNAGSILMTTTTATVQALTTGLAAQGWHTSEDPVVQGFAASKGEWSIRVYPAFADGSPTDRSAAEAVAVEFGRTQPGRVWPLVAVGYLLGLAAGWFVGWFAGRRVVGWVLLGALVLLLPGTVITTGDIIAAVALPADATPPALWGDYLFIGIRAFTTVGLLVMAVSLLLGLRGARAARSA
ncbi:hypothetical protein [Dactylosporangium sp. NPDC051484]|uniref:hypothetical protein n=1 Tax=Dactylosporangium sp. NPDC051484 TaxID=3154942 RepID=UPI003450ADA6